LQKLYYIKTNTHAAASEVHPNRKIRGEKENAMA
jgi:hypothetical protein